MYNRSDTRMRASCGGTRLYTNNQDESPAALGVSHCPAAMVLSCADINTNRDSPSFKAQASPSVGTKLLYFKALHFAHTEYYCVSSHCSEKTLIFFSEQRLPLGYCNGSNVCGEAEVFNIN